MKLLGIAAIAGLALLGLPAQSQALPVCGSAPGTDVISYNAGGGCEVDGLIFSDFSVVDAGNPSIELVNAVGSALVGNVVFFQFNPNLASPGIMQDIHFYFRVRTMDGSPSIIGVDLTNGGTGDTNINERVCTSTFFLGTCTGQTIAAISAASGGSAEGFFAGVNSAYIFKDIFKGLGVAGPTDDGHLTSFTQSFHTAVPEPASLMLLGTGLAAAARARRRAQKSKA